jgi:kynurenine formamidase
MLNASQSPQAGKMSAYGALPVPTLTPELLTLVKTGKVYSLAVMHTEQMLAPKPMVSYTVLPHLRHGDLHDLAPASAAAEVITMSSHVGTHIDALCHIGERQNVHGEPDTNGEVHLYDREEQTTPANQHVDFHGQSHMTIAEMPPIITRGVLLDVAHCKGVDVLPPAYTITRKDIEDTLTAQGTHVHSGTGVLIRTGFYQHLITENPIYRDAIAGIGLEAAQFLFEQGMILAGADNMSVESVPPLDHPVHRFLLVHHGVTHLENLYLEQLSADQAYEFLFIVTPLRLQGATGSWVHPLAIT